MTALWPFLPSESSRIFKACSTFYSVFFIAIGTIVFQHFLNYCGCYSNIRPPQDIAAGGVCYWQRPLTAQLSLVHWVEGNSQHLPSSTGMNASAILCPSQLASEGSFCLLFWNFHIGVVTSAIIGIFLVHLVSKALYLKSFLFWEVATHFKQLH